MEGDERSVEWMEELSGDARLIWSDGDARASALEDIVVAWRQGDPELDSLINRVDSAVVEGLAALGFPRGPVMDIEIRELSLSQSGQKLPDCRIILVGATLESTIASGRPDRFFGSWIHESIHARRPYVLSAGKEYRQFRGFEEGLVEGLTRHVLERAAIEVEHGSFSYYVMVYEQLASALGVETIELWQRLWSYPTGSVGIAFVDVVDGLNRNDGRTSLTQRQKQGLFVTAATLFRTSQDRDVYDPLEIWRQWKVALDESTGVF